MTEHLDPGAIIATAHAAGVTIDMETAARIIRSIGPAMDGFASGVNRLPFDLEPAHFVVVQHDGSRA